MLVFGMAPVAALLATSSEIDLGTPGTLHVHGKFSFDELNGIQLTGHSLSLDFNFANNEFVRLFSITSSLFSAEIDLHTNGAGQLGVLQGTGHLVDVNGQPIPGFDVTGNSSGDGSLSLGLFPLLKDQNGTPNKDLLKPLDFFGVDFDLSLPNVQNPSIHVTGADFAFFSDVGKPFGVGPGVPHNIVPEGGNTAILLITSWATLIAIRRRMRMPSAIALCDTRGERITINAAAAL